MSEFKAFFVGGPQNGTTMFLPNGTRGYRFPKQRTLEALDIMSNSRDIDIRLDHMRCDFYERVFLMRNPYHRDCWVFEWMGER